MVSYANDNIIYIFNLSFSFEIQLVSLTSDNKYLLDDSLSIHGSERIKPNLLYLPAKETSPLSMVPIDSTIILVTI